MSSERPNGEVHTLGVPLVHHWRRSYERNRVRNVCASILLCIVMLALTGCGPHYPEMYGVYADTNHGQIRLEGQQIRSAGTFMGAYFGLPRSSGPECISLKDLIVYEKNLDPSTVGLSRLTFLKDGVVGMAPFQQRIRINLWVPENNGPELDVKPVDGRSDMYVFTPREPLTNGFYALHLGPFRGDVSGEVRVFDIVVGSPGDYQPTTK